jgi:hypothetical protein
MNIRGGAVRKRKRRRKKKKGGGLIGASSSTWTPAYLSRQVPASGFIGLPRRRGGPARARPLRNFARRMGANVLRNIGGKRGSGMSFHGAGMAIHGAGLRGKRVLPRYGSGKRRV